MEISVIMNIVNVAFNAIFVFGLGMGVLGVGLATLISRIVAGFIMTGKVLSADNPLQLRDLSLFMPQGQYIKNILRIGIPSGIENGMFQIGKLVVVSIVATFGTQAIAANSIGYQIMDFPNIPGQSVGLALVTIVGQCMGAGNVAEARRYTVKMMKLAYLSDWICKITLAICVPWVVGWFSLTEGTAALAVFLLRCFCLASLPAWPMSFVMPNALRAAGDVKYTMTVSIASMWICRICCSYLLGVVMNMGILGVWCGMFVDWYARSICYLARYLSGKWSYKKVV
jgi:putative MATE family efflux protein